MKLISKIRAAIAFSLILVSSFVHAGVWSGSTQITQLGAWAPWFGVVVPDTAAEIGCSGAGVKAIDISTSTPTKQAQISLLIAAYTAGKLVKLYYDGCVGGTSLITNVQIVPN